MAGTIWVGPTKCDEARTRRTRKVEKIWRALKPDLNLHLDLGNAVDFFREAQSCYQNGAYMATALMCRASTETAIYLALARKRRKFQISINLGFIDHEWVEILAGARRRRLVDLETERMLDHVRRKGNFVAHYGQKFDRKLAQGQGSGRLWISGAEAVEILRQTVKILDRLRQALNPDQI